MMDFVCPVCRGALVQEGTSTMHCPKDKFTYPLEDGIWRFLVPEQIAHYEAFIRDYETIRQAEGRSRRNPSDYSSLPFEDRSGVMPAMWAMRAKSFQTFVHRVLRKMGSRPLHILDLGAGNGWLSNRLAEMGHHVDAVDLLTNDWDGLGVHQYYETNFRPVQASFDNLPFPDQSYDLVVFNASLHYSTDYAHTLHHALDLLKHDGRLVIIDTPFYAAQSSGNQMVQERQEDFLKSYGFRSDALPLENYLTYNRLRRLAENARLDIWLHRPWFGFRHLVAPFRARLAGRREPARFPVVALQRRR